MCPSTGTERVSAPGEAYRFAGSSRNVYGDYLHMTFVRKNVLLYLGACLIAAAVVAAGVCILSDPGQIEDLYRDIPRTPRRVFMRTYAVPFACACIPLGLFLLLFFGIPLLRRGCSAFGFAWPRLYGRLCARDHRKRFADTRRAYFASLERFPMEASAGERSVRYRGADGAAHTFAYRDCRRAFRAHGLVVLESGPTGLPSSTVLLDERELPPEERRAFRRFLDARLPAGCRCYYVRAARPPGPSSGAGGGTAGNMERGEAE